MNRRTKKAVATAALLVVGAVASREAQAQISLTTAGSGNYSQNFDTLSSDPTPTITKTWTDNVTIGGWYTSRGTYNVNDGSSNSGQIYSFGTAGSGDRALGSTASGTPEMPEATTGNPLAIASRITFGRPSTLPCASWTAGRTNRSAAR